MAVRFGLDTLYGDQGAYAHDLAFGLGPQQNLGSVSGTVTFDPTVDLGGNMLGVGTLLCSPSGSLTGAIIVAGIVERQRLCIVNEHASNTITFAAVGTSHVAGGAAVVVPANAALSLIWDSNTSLWVPMVAASLNVSGVTSTSTELNYLHGVTPGTASASHAAVLGASKNLDTLSLAQENIGPATAETAAATTTLDVTKTYHRVAVDGSNFSGAINAAASGAGNDGDLLITEFVNTPADGTVTVTFTTNFKPSATLAVTQGHYASVTWVSNGTTWHELTRSAIIAV